MYSKRRKSINYEAVCKTLVFLGFAWFFYSVIESGAVELYVHARIIPYLKFAIGALVLIAFFTMGEILQQVRRKVPTGRYTLFFVTLILAISFPAVVAVPNSIYLGGSAQGENTEVGEEGNLIPEASQETSGQEGGAGELGDPVWGLSLQNGKVLMDDYNFVGWLNEIYGRLDLYEGIEIETSGFVFRSEEFLQDQFVPARMVMMCCAADAQPVGFLCSFAKAGNLPNDTWVKVTGRITQTTYGEEVVPLIQVEKVVPVKKPETEYIYPME